MGRDPRQEGHAVTRLVPWLVLLFAFAYIGAHAVAWVVTSW
jgi:hypothetical protein